MNKRKDKPGKAIFSTHIDPEIKEALSYLAIHEDKNIYEIVEEALIEHMERNEAFRKKFPGVEKLIRGRKA